MVSRSHPLVGDALGVGGDDSWGARTLSQYLLPAGELVFRFGFSGVG